MKVHPSLVWIIPSINNSMQHQIKRRGLITRPGKMLLHSTLLVVVWDRILILIDTLQDWVSSASDLHDTRAYLTLRTWLYAQWWRNKIHILLKCEWRVLHFLDSHKYAVKFTQQTHNFDSIIYIKKKNKEKKIILTIWVDDQRRCLRRVIRWLPEVNCKTSHLGQSLCACVDGLISASINRTGKKHDACLCMPECANIQHTITRCSHSCGNKYNHKHTFILEAKVKVCYLVLPK